MKCKKCDFNVEEILSIIDNGEKRVVLCPNHVMGMVLGAYTFEDVGGSASEYEASETCDCCVNDAIYFNDSGTEYKVCRDHMMKLLKKNLTPKEWNILTDKYGKKAFLLHDDFYDDFGIAMQPVE